MLNFKKKTIFNKNLVEEESYFSNKVLAVWGSPSSGKTTVACQIAKYLSNKKKNVLLLLCDMTAPMLPCICPKNMYESNHSLGSIIAGIKITENLVKQNLNLLKNNNYLGILGLLKGENEYFYPSYNDKQAKELINILRGMFDCVIIDCSSYIVNDILSAVSLMESDDVLRLVNCDLKSISYLSSQLPLLKDNKWDSEKQYKIANNIKTNQASEMIEEVMGNVAFKLPYSQEIENLWLEGNILKDLCLKDSRVFKKEIEKICKEVFYC